MFLGLEAGATRSVALLADAAGRCVQRIEAKTPANLRLLSDAQLLALLQNFARQLPRPVAVGIGMAGALDEADRQRIRTAAARVWPEVPCWAGHDLATALAAAGGPSDAGKTARVIVISGTGASCYGRRANGGEVLTGGWGHLVGDRGSGYDMARRALESVFRTLDETGQWPALGRRFLRALRLDSPGELIAWAGGADKSALAALAVEIFSAAAKHDPIAREILAESAGLIARNAVACARRLVPPGRPVEFVLTGSVLQKQPGFARRVARRLKSSWPGASVKMLAREGAWGAVRLAQQQQDRPPFRPVTPSRPAGVSGLIPRARGLSPTEQRHPLSQHLDKMSVSAAIRLMLGEDATIPAALRREEKKISEAVRLIVRCFRRGGRLFYVGAGTSGRLGALDAYECPPTFSVSPEMTQAIVAGGDQAMSGAQEDAEDDVAAGAQALHRRGVSRKDLVVGLAASGRTPFVWGALHAARQRGATTILVCFNPNLVFPRGTRPALVIAPKIGPEILTGSTRLKAGTATKLVLNIFTTLSMVQLGKVVQNLMVDVQPTNEKLRDRAVRIVQQLTGAARVRAENALEQNGWVVKQALAVLKQSPPAPQPSPKSRVRPTIQK